MLSNIQIGRAVAALSVVFGHTLLEAQKLNSSSWATDLVVTYPFGSGVDVFFVISGFIMCHISRTRLRSPGYAWNFLIDRLVRVVPLYWFYTMLVVLLLLALPKLFDTAALDAEHVLMSFMFFPGVSDTWPKPVFALGWTLNYEMFFYISFALAILLARQRAVAVLIVAFVVLAALHPWLSNGPYFLEFWSRGLILEFLAGIVLALLPWDRLLYKRSLGMALILLAPLVMLLLYHGTNLSAKDARWVIMGISATLFVAGLLALEAAQVGQTNRVFDLRGSAILLGDASYSFYLSHPFTLSAVYVIWPKTGPIWAYVFVAVLASVIVSVISYKVIEMPLRATMRRYHRV